MFDNVQDGIVVLNINKNINENEIEIEFMNDLSRKFMCFLSKL